MIKWLNFSFQSVGVVMAKNACAEGGNDSKEVNLHKTNGRVVCMFSGFKCDIKLSKPGDFNSNTTNRYYGIEESFHHVNNHLILDEII